jgi:hypothetical protein
MKTVLWKAAAALLLAMIAGCASAPRAERYAALPPGASWVTQHQDSGSFGSGRSEVASRMAEQVWEGQNLLALQSPENTLLIQPTGPWVAMLAKDGKTAVTWDPPLHWDWPLEVGKSWTRQYKVKIHAQNRIIPFEARSTVEAHEEMTVPAGTFKTFRVRTTDSIGNDNVIWYSPEVGLFVKAINQRTEKHAQGPGRSERQLMSISRAR